jgi:large subunit ribosomal protein L9
MQVIILEEVRGVGKKYEVKDVSAGYARNFLFPNKLAEPANPTSLKKLEAMKAEHNAKEIELHKHLEALARRVSDMTIEFDLKKGKKDGSIFGVVNKESILKALREHKLITTERVDITLDHPIKEFGSYTIPIDFKKGVTAQLKIVVKEE